MGAELAAAGVSALASLGSTALSNQLASDRAADDKVYQIGVIKQGQNWQEKMLDRMNWYSSPSAAMARYREAGFNPYLASGSMGRGVGETSMSPPNSTGAPSVAVQPRDYSLGPSLAQLGVAYGNQNIEKQKMLLEMYPKIREYFGRDAAKEWASSNGFPFGDNAEMFNRMDMEADLMDAKRAHEDSQRFFLEKMGYAEGQARINEINQHISKMQEEMNVLRSEGKLNEKSAYELGTRMVRNMAEAGLFKAGAKYQNLQTSIGDATAQYVISQMEDDAMIRSLQYQERQLDWDWNSAVRYYKGTKSGKLQRFGDFMANPDTNPILGLMKGISDALPKLGINYKSPINMQRYTSNPWQVSNYGTYNYYR